MYKNLALSLGLIYLLAAPAFAQDTTQTTTRTARQQPVAKIAAKMSEEAGVKILVTYALTQQLVTVPDDPATTTNLDETLTTLTRRLPDATWAKVYLPTPTDGRPYKADAVAQFAQAEAGLFGRPDKTQTSLVSLLGKRMTADEAQPYIKQLGLQPYYVLMTRNGNTSNPNAKLADLKGFTAANITPALDALMKRLGVTSPKDIPTGDYEVTIPGADGTPQKAQVSVENTEGKSTIRVNINSDHQ